LVGYLGPSNPHRDAGVPGCGARPVHRAAKRAGAAIGSGGGRLRCRTTTPTMGCRMVLGRRTGGGYSMATPSPTGRAGLGTASGVNRSLGEAG
jgi:hypothetical protein